MDDSLTEVPMGSIRGKVTSSFIRNRDALFAVLSVIGITVYAVQRYGVIPVQHVSSIPLIFVLIFGGIPLISGLIKGILRGEFGSDILAGISIITSVFLGEYLAGSLVVLMLAGGRALERFAVARASGALAALAKRMPTMAHRKNSDRVEDIPVETIEIGDSIAVFPHEVCPVDGIVIEGHGRMNEAYLTGEPFEVSKTPGAETLSGAINGENLLTIRATKQTKDSRHAKIMQVMQSSAQQRPRIRRLGDRLGSVYTPIALSVAVASWILSGDPIRFLAVLVVATPCPLIIAIPIAIIGSLSLAARRGIVIRDPASLELIDTCRTIIVDKTGTLTRGRPSVTDVVLAEDFDRSTVLSLVASLEQYSKHPLASAILRLADKENVILHEAQNMSEPPGHGLQGVVRGHNIEVTNRKKIPDGIVIPETLSGLECVVLIDSKFAALIRFHDEPLKETSSFISHLGPSHHLHKVMIVSGDRESEVRYLAERVGIKEVHFSKTPEEKVKITRTEVSRAPTVFLGDGINDAPALLAATVGIAIGPGSDVASEAAGAVVLESSLLKVDELFHIGRRMRRIALQSAVGGMILSIGGMGFAAIGVLPPVVGALVQELIDLVAVLNAQRALVFPLELSDMKVGKS